MTTYDPEWEQPTDAEILTFPAGLDLVIAYLSDQDPSERYAETRQEDQRS